jgi:hypothetical protein
MMQKRIWALLPRDYDNVYTIGIDTPVFERKRCGASVLDTALHNGYHEILDAGESALA